MSNIIAAVGTLTGAVYAIDKENDDDKAEHLLKLNDFIYDEDVYITYQQSVSKISTTDSHRVRLNFSESWTYEKDGFIKLAANEKISRASEPLQSSDIADNTLSADDLATTDIELSDEGGFKEAYRVNSQSLNGRTIRLSETILSDLFSVSDKESFNSTGGLLASQFSYSNYRDDFFKYKKIFNALVNNDQAFYDPRTNFSPINSKKIIADVFANKISLQLNNDGGVSDTDAITSDPQVNLIGLEVDSIWVYSLDFGASWVLGIGSSFTLAAATETAMVKYKLKQQT